MLAGNFSPFLAKAGSRLKLFYNCYFVCYVCACVHVLCAGMLLLGRRANKVTVPHLLPSPLPGCVLCSVFWLQRVCMSCIYIYSCFLISTFLIFFSLFSSQFSNDGRYLAAGKKMFSLLWTLVFLVLFDL